jgi:protein-disulfide isomerase
MLMKVFVTLGLISSALCVSGIAQTAGSGAPTTASAIVEIDGAKISVADFEQKRAANLFHARNSFYDEYRKALDEYVNDYLLEHQAKKEGVTVAELLERHVNSTLPKDPSEEALHLFYEGLETNEPFDKLKDKILDHIRETRAAKAKTAYVASLREQAKINIRLGPPRVQVPLKDTPVRGIQSAPVMIVEYADYECAYCQQAQPVLDRLENEYKGKVAFAFKDMPLPMHPHAPKAAEAARCAGAQGKYWEFHDLLFKNKQLELAQLKDDARELKLDSAAFDKCLDSGAQADAIKVTQAEGKDYSLKGTPSFFINGRLFDQGAGYDQLKAVIEEELAQHGARTKQTASINK